MSPEALRLVERLHAVVAWVATAALVATAWLFVRSSPPRRAARASGAMAVGLVLVASGLGVVLHDPYRFHQRQRLFVQSAALGWLFERKEHAAFAAVLFGVAALAALLHLERGHDRATARDVSRSAALAWTVSAVLALAASIASTIVARHVHF